MKNHSAVGGACPPIPCPIPGSIPGPITPYLPIPNPSCRIRSMS